jgi:succinate-acetate transporter protein
MILWTVFVFAMLIGSLPTNLAYIAIFLLVDLGFLFVASSYFAAADGKQAVAGRLKKAGGGFCFVAGLVGWYVVFHLLLAESVVVLPLGDTGRVFGRKGKRGLSCRWVGM